MKDTTTCAAAVMTTMLAAPAAWSAATWGEDLPEPVITETPDGRAPQPPQPIGIIPEELLRVTAPQDWEDLLDPEGKGTSPPEWWETPPAPRSAHAPSADRDPPVGDEVPPPGHGGATVPAPPGVLVLSLGAAALLRRSRTSRGA